jgi:hypothetical protein
MSEQKPERIVFCPACSRILGIPEDKGVGDEIECPFCVAKYVLEIREVFVGRLTQPSPFAIEDPDAPLAGKKR